MAITQDYILKGGLASSDAAANNRLQADARSRLQTQQDQSAAERQREQQDAALKLLLTGKNADLSNDQAKAQSDIANAQALRDKYGNSVAVRAGSASLGDTDPLARLLKRRELEKPQLTPAETETEKKSGDELAKYETGGGRVVSDESLKTVKGVRDDLQKRDAYDRIVGGAVSGFPSVMGVVAPAEKARRDRAYSAAANRLKQLGDPNPTEVRIKETMGQIYDPSSDNETNDARLAAFERQLSGTRDQMEQNSANLRSTGYIMPGLAGSSPRSSGNIVPRSPVSASQQPANGAPNVRDLSNEDLAKLYKQLKGGR